MHFRRLIPILLWLALLSGCDNPAEPSVDDVAGSYVATTLAVTPAGRSTVDLLREGSTLQITLAPDGTTSGRISVADEGGEEILDEDLAGSWTLAGDIVRFSHPADTFLRDMEFTVAADRLEGEATFPGSNATIRVVLDKR